MKRPLFTVQEKELIATHVSAYLKEYRENNYPLEPFEDGEHEDDKQIRRAKSILTKLSDDGDEIAFTPLEKTTIHGCISRYKHILQQQIPRSNSAIFWLTISDEQRAIVKVLDACLNIETHDSDNSKKGFGTAHSDPHFRYGKVLTEADKLRQCDKVFLGKTASHDFYKIGFAQNEQEYLHFKFGDKMDREILVFAPNRAGTLQNLRDEKFSLLTTKEEARKILSDRPVANYERESFEIVNLLLNQ